MSDGKLVVSEEVFGDIAQQALYKVEEVTRKKKSGGIGRIFTGRLGSNVTVKKDDTESSDSPGTVSLDLRLTVAYGVSIPEVAGKVRDAIIKDINAITGYDVERIDITVDKLVRAEDLEKGEQ